MTYYEYQDENGEWHSCDGFQYCAYKSDGVPVRIINPVKELPE